MPKTSMVSGAIPTAGWSRWRDVVDWVGGDPYEVASPQEILAAGDSRAGRPGHLPVNVEKRLNVGLRRKTVARQSLCVC